jgi:hypothetical protein
MSTDDETKFTAGRAEIDPVFKEVLIFNFGQLNILLQTQVEVSRLPRTMDALVVLHNPEDLKKVREETVFSYFRIHNQIEFKGKEDALTRASYHLILGRANLYLGEKDISAKEMTVTIISAHKPIKVLRHCQDDVRWEEIDVGHYVSTDILPVHLFVSNELAIEPKNYPLLLFASSKEKFRQFVERIVSEENTVYIYYAHFVDYELTEEVLKMAGKQSSYQKNLERVTQDLLSILGKEKLLKMMTPEERLRGLSPEERVRGLSPEVRVQGLSPEVRVRGLTLEERLCGLDPQIQEKIKQLLFNTSETKD